MWKVKEYYNSLLMALPIAEILLLIITIIEWELI